MNVFFKSVLLLVAINFVSNSAFASGIGLGAIATVSAGGALASGGAALPVAGGAQIVGAVVCFFFDPPDTQNAGTAVDINDYFIAFPDATQIDPNVDTGVATAFDNHYDNLDWALAYGRARAASLDRYEGALILGNNEWADQRLSEANQYWYQARTWMANALTTMDLLLGAVDIFDDTILDQIVTKDAVRNMRDEIASGVIPSFEDIVVSSYSITQDEQNRFFASMSNVSDADIDSLFIEFGAQGDELSARDAISKGFVKATDCSDCTVPEPTTIALMLSGLMTLVITRYKKSV